MMRYVDRIEEELKKLTAFLDDPEDPVTDAEAAEAVDNIFRATVAYYIRETGEGSDIMNRILGILVKE